MLLLSSNPSLYQFDEYLNYFREMVKYQCKIGGRENILDILGLTKEEALEYCNAAINGTVNEWAEKHNAFE